MTLERLKRFRQDVYELLGKAADATMDLMDAVLTTKSIQSFAELCLSPLFKRKWPSLYEAIEDVRPQRDELMKLYIDEIPDIQEKRVILAGDHTPWSRVYATTHSSRTFGTKIEHTSMVLK